MGKTWRDFMDFYNNPIIKSLAPKEKWTVSSTKSVPLVDKNGQPILGPDGVQKMSPAKMPIDMKAYIEKDQIWGAAYDRGYNPLLSLDALCQAIPNATNNAFLLDVDEDNIIVLDIEPYCPDDIKSQLLRLPYLYAETSMSGRGYHLVFEVPDILRKYPDAMVKDKLQHSAGYYEILLGHMITFTRNALPPQTEVTDIQVLYDLCEALAKEAKPHVEGKAFKVEDLDTDNIPNFKTIFDIIKYQKYSKKPSDFKKKDPSGHVTNIDDASSYEFGLTGFYYNCLKKLLKTDVAAKDHVYTNEEKAVIIYLAVMENIPYDREKHHTDRNGMPYLLYMATKIVSTNAAQEEANAKKKANDNPSNINVNDLWLADE